ncbi:MAG: hypothetical protein M3004_05520 [Bacteroidota bacterium]|nr:hypothetical protein [Bacteroidota bacterium]
MSEKQKIEEQPSDDSSQSTNMNNAVELPTTNQKLQTKEMEVHKHPHHVTHQKKWTEYLLEFFMLFLAVTLGFFAESIREGRVERSHEKAYIKSLNEDLQTDITTNQNEIKSIPERIIRIDSLKMFLNSGDINQHANDIYFLSRQIQRATFSLLNDRTLVQLRNAGGMRIIENKQLSDSIFYYYKMGEFKNYSNQLLYSHFRETDAIFEEIFNGNYFDKTLDSTGNLLRLVDPVTLRSLDAKSISSYILILSRIKSLSLANINNNIRLIKKAENMRNIISKEYHLPNE